MQPSPSPIRPCVFLALVILTAAAQLRADNPKPPKPNPYKPVNYIAWINRTYGAGLDENAAKTYRQAVAELDSFEDEWDDVLRGPWTDHKPTADWLDAHRKNMELFRKAAAMKACFLEIPEPKPTGDPRRDHLLANFAFLLPDSRGHVDLAKALLADGFRVWPQGDHKTLFANATAVLKSAHHLTYGTTDIQRWVAAYLSCLACNAMRNALRVTSDPAAEATKTLKCLAETADPDPPIQQTYLLERLAVLDLCQRSYLPGKDGEKWTLYEPMVGGNPNPIFSAEDLLWLERRTYHGVTREVNEVFDELDRWAAEPYPQAARRASEFERKIQAHPNPMIRLFVPAFTRVHTIEQHAVASRRATALVAHLLIYRSRTGGFPTSLDALKTPELAAIRQDPYSGKDFLYRLQGKSFILYSISENLTDDGGRHDENWRAADYVFWPMPERHKPPEDKNQEKGPISMLAPQFPDDCIPLSKTA